MNPKEAPEIIQPSKLDLIFPKKIELENGLKLYWLDEVKDESVKLDIEWNAGSKYQSDKLVSSFTNKLLLAGTDKLSSKEISEQIDFYGGFIGHENDKDHAGFTIYGLNENISDIFKIVSNAIDNCAFPEDQLKKDLAISRDKYRIESEKVKSLCRREFNQNIFGKESVYGQFALLEDFDKLKRESIVEFYSKFYKKQKPVLFLVGNVSDEFIDELKNWSKQFTVNDEKNVEIELNQTKGRVDVKKEGAIQSAIRIGRLFVNKSHEDYFDFQVLNTILGGYFGSRLMANIREDKGYTYGIGSGVAVLESASYFFITTEVAAEVKDATISEIYNELDRLKEELVSEEELTKVKNYLLGEFLRNSDGPIAMMENFKNIYFNNLSESYYSDFINAIHDLTAKRLKELANTYLQKEDLLEVVAG